MTYFNNQYASNYIILFSAGLTFKESTSNVDGDFGNMLEREQVTLTCKNTYYGLWGPKQNWTDSAGYLIPATDLSSGTIVAYTYIVSKDGPLALEDNDVFFSVVRNNATHL